MSSGGGVEGGGPLSAQSAGVGMAVKKSSLQEMDLSALDPIPLHSTLVILNHFVVSTLDFIESFASAAESRMLQVSRQISRAEVLASLLETKLQSIDWLSQQIGVQGTGSSQGQADEIEQTKDVEAEFEEVSQGTSSETEIKQEESENEKEIQKEIMIKDDPRFEKFFRMLKIGAAKQQIQMQMRLEGLDASIIE